MSGRPVTIILTMDEACCLNNALRAELERARRKLHDPEWLGFDEYVRRLDACIAKVGEALAEALAPEKAEKASAA
ncbi:MAG: hypothetical protein BGN87_06310 [Rhizobiales bacterium 65-79]|jgi:hypothetical protein|nr:hypothetical protein [Hyphomicrobiales bacterium]OJU02803.1 MAG: hypothetical protein BGN87_06310 [Rhizobiales bacterium 65-79]